MQLQWLAKTALKYQQDIYAHLSSRLADKYGLYASPEHIEDRFENVDWEVLAERITAAKKEKKEEMDKEKKKKEVHGERGEKGG